jgi:hypothetical protein
VVYNQFFHVKNLGQVHTLVHPHSPTIQSIGRRRIVFLFIHLKAKRNSNTSFLKKHNKVVYIDCSMEFVNKQVSKR